MVLALMVALALPVPAFAAGGQAQATTDLPVSLANIRRALRERPPASALDQFKLAYYVSVTADAPPINLFKDFDWKHGAVPGSPPSQQELFRQVTPQEFSAPVANFTAIAGWLGSKFARKSPSK